MDANIESQFQRAEELFHELQDEYGSALDKQEVTKRALNLTIETLMKLRNILDQVLHQYYEKRILPNLDNDEKKKVKVYFPIAVSEEMLQSILGRARMQEMKKDDPEVYDLIKSYQPFVDINKNRWLGLLSEYTVQGKHIQLVPQTKVVHERITVKGNSGAVVSWNPKSVRFGKGVTICDSPVDPNTQTIVPGSNAKEFKESWTTFNFEGTHINALALCKECLEKSRVLVEKFSGLINQ
jgi:hypothetical protein